MELYQYARPSLMAGKKIIYIHGFASAGSTGTAERLRVLMPNATVISPDVPVEPAEAQAFLKDLCQKEQPDLIIGTSMGGMFTEQLSGFDRICVNPALHLEETIRKNMGLGKMEFQNPRTDGQTWFMITKCFLDAFRVVTAQRLKTNDGDRVWGLFGREDTLVDCYDEFHAHYRQAIRFNGEHALNEKAMLHALLPVIQWVDDRQEKRKKRVLLINVDDVLYDTRNGEPVNEAVRGFRTLAQQYDVYLLCQQDRQAWIDRWLDVPAWNRVILGTHKELMLGDYLIDAHSSEDGADGFLGTLIKFGEEPFRNWAQTLEFFDRLGGQ